MNSYKVTDEHMQIFKTKVQKEVGAFGLMDWSIDFDWIDDLDNNALAQIETVVSNRVALFRLNRVWTEQPTPEKLERVAYHEVLELMFNPLLTIAKLDENEVTSVGKAYLLEAEHHAIIRRLENIYRGPWPT